jgi:hypothetical protein
MAKDGAGARARARASAIYSLISRRQTSSEKRIRSRTPLEQKERTIYVCSQAVRVRAMISVLVRKTDNEFRVAQCWRLRRVVAQEPSSTFPH